jgi:hypothetical protein
MKQKYPDDANGRVLRSMAASGADMMIPYDVDFEHVFPKLESAEDFGKRVAKMAARVEVSEYDGASGYYWQVQVVVRMTPSHAEISRVEAELGTLADAHGGRSDGWGILH